MVRIVYVFIAFFLLSLFVLVPNTQAQGQNLRTNANVQDDFRNYTQTTFIEVAAALSCNLTGVDPVNPNTPCLGVNSQTGTIGYSTETQGGLIGATSSMIAATYYIPVSSSDYGRYLASSFGVVNQGYAQDGGVGFQGLQPLLGIWTVFRNVVYSLLIFVFFLVGIGIMFRRQVDPRTVMSVQNQLPRIVLVILLITFSFAIVGFFIDVMYVLLYFLYELFASIPGVNLSAMSPASTFGHTPFSVVNDGFGGGITGIADSAADGVGDIIGSIFAGHLGGTVAMILGGVIGGVAGSIVPGVGTLIGVVGGAGIGGFAGWHAGSHALSFIGSIIAFVVFAFAILIALFRLWFALLKAYVYILIDTVLAPFWIAGSLIPGSPLSVGSWLRHLISYLLVFPATLVMFLFAAVFIQVFSNGAGKDAFLPPFIGNPGNPGFFGALIGFAIILMTPEVVRMVKDALGAPDIGYGDVIAPTIAGGAKVGAVLPKKVGEKFFERNQDGSPKGFGARLFDVRRRELRDQAGNLMGGSSEKLGLGRLTQGRVNPLRPVKWAVNRTKQGVRNVNEQSDQMRAAAEAQRNRRVQVASQRMNENETQGRGESATKGADREEQTTRPQHPPNSDFESEAVGGGEGVGVRDSDEFDEGAGREASGSVGTTPSPAVTPRPTESNREGEERESPTRPVGGEGITPDDLADRLENDRRYNEVYEEAQENYFDNNPVARTRPTEEDLEQIRQNASELFRERYEDVWKRYQEKDRG